MINGCTSICVANDTDFAFLGWHNILQLSSFKLRGKSREQRKIVDLSLITPHYSIIDKIFEIDDCIDRVTMLLAKYRIFDIIPNNHYMVRALRVVYLGDDTNPGGIARVGPSL